MQLAIYIFGSLQVEWKNILSIILCTSNKHIARFIYSDALVGLYMYKYIHMYHLHRCSIADQPEVLMLEKELCFEVYT